MPEEFTLRPLQIPLPCPIHLLEKGLQACVIVAEPAEEFKARLAEHGAGHVFAKVIGVDKFMKHFKLHRQKVELLNNYQLFFCDWRVYNLLKEGTGKLFVERKKVPFPIDCQQVPAYLTDQFPTYREYLQDLLCHSYAVAGHGPVYSLKAARLSMPVREAVKNIIHAVMNFVPHVAGKRVDSLRRVSLKTSKSVSLPVLCRLTASERQAMQD